MKTVIFLFAFCVCAISQAASVIIYDRPAREFGTHSYITPSFSANLKQPELGRAWVNLKITYSDSEAPSDDKILRVEGLAFNAADSVIEFTHEGRVVVCAHVSHRRFTGTRIAPTGNCMLELKRVQKEVDHWPYISKVEYIQVFLNVE